MSDYEALRMRLKSGEYDGNDIMQAWLALDQITRLQSEVERLRGRLAESEESASRWSALINCARIRPLGSAGLNGTSHDPNDVEWGNRAHLGLELWTIHSDHHSLADERRVGVEWLTKFADKAIDANAQRLRQQAAECE